MTRGVDLSVTKLEQAGTRPAVTENRLNVGYAPFPVGRSREGLPIRLQAIGPYIEDRTPIRFATLLAKEIGGFSRPAGYDAS